MASRLPWSHEANVWTWGHRRSGDEKPACFINLAGLFWKPASPQVWLRQLPFRQVTAPCPVTAVVCLPPRHPPCVYMSLSDWREEAHDLEGFGFSNPDSILILPVWFPGGSAVFFSSPACGSTWSYQKCLARPQLLGGSASSSYKQPRLQHKGQDFRKVLTTLWSDVIPQTQRAAGIDWTDE